MAKIKHALVPFLTALMLFGVCAATAGCSDNGKVDNLQQQIAELESKLGEQNDKISDMQEEIDNQNGEIADLQKKLDEQTEENIKLKNEFNQYTETMKELVDQTTLSGFYSLKQAYYLGLLTKSDLMSIAYYHNGGTRYNEEIMGETYAPIPKNPAELSEDLEYYIKDAYLQKINSNNKTDIVATMGGVFIEGYYGIYGDYAVLFITDNYGDYPTVIGCDMVDGVKFYYSNGNRITILKLT